MAANNPYEGRWRWWYEAIADWMIRNPGRPLAECAKELNKAANTIYMITATDNFKTYLAHRRAEFREMHDLTILSKTAAVAELGLDLMLESMQHKRSGVPLSQLNSITNNALKSLGYGIEKPQAVQVNVQQNNLPPAVSADTLLEARAALRQLEERRIAAPTEMLAIEKGESLDVDNDFAIDAGDET